jgi:Tlde1 domain
MAWTYHQSTGEIDHNGKKVGHGYAGRGKWQNVPQAQNRSKEGPLPQGKYTIAGHFITDPTVGKHALRLAPDPHNRMFGRSRFLIHGDNPRHVGGSSEGCIVTSYRIRVQILHSGDGTLEVVP